MVADVRRLVFVVRERRGQRRIVRMREIIVPEEPFLTAIELIAVGSNQARREIKFFAQAQSDVARPENLPFRNPGKGLSDHTLTVEWRTPGCSSVCARKRL